MSKQRLVCAYSSCLAAMAVWVLGCGGGGGGKDPEPDATPGPGVCNNGVVDGDELCDPGADACCNDTCDGRLAAGTECRPAAGPCDVAEICNGRDACPADALASAGTECGAAASMCNVAETCDGASAACPDDVTAPDGMACDDCLFGPGNCSTCSAGQCQPAAGVVVVNEIDANTAGNEDVSEFIELYDGGVGNTVLDGLVLVLVNGENEKVYQSFDLTGFVTDAGGFFVIGSVTLGAAADFQIPVNLLQNGPDAVAVYRGDVASYPVDAPLSTENLVDAIVYGLARDDELAVLIPDQVQADETESGNAEAHSTQRVPDGAGGPRVTSAFVAAPPTPGAPNAALD
jgi:hypothetical protein